LKASPLARRMAADAQINLELVPGSGPAGRIVQRDIKAYLMRAIPAAPVPSLAPIATTAQPVAAAQPVKAASVPVAPLPSPSTSPPPDQHIPLARLRAAIGRRMAESKRQAPHFYVTHEYDVEALLALRAKINTLLPDEDKLSVNDFIVKAVALVLRQFPNLNAALQGDQVVQYGAVNIGVAVAVASGLLTVVCCDADRKSLRQISGELRLMAGRARQGKVHPEDIEGSTFSVSNLGMYEVEHFIAILNPPEAAILAIGSARQVPVIKDSQVVPGWRMKASLSVDHRVSDGAEAARFLQALTPYLEEPVRLLL
jgi:pyruvate dehydrogenase E2 component (dihydrolipoamide acetyltransferase)